MKTLKKITVTVPSYGDKARDILRVRRVHGALVSFPGEDEFFLVLDGETIAFPNENTSVEDGLMSRLTDLVGLENVEISQ